MYPNRDTIEFMASLRLGQFAPNFTLTTQDGHLFTLSDAIKQSPVVLVFYTMDSSPNCSRLLCRINADLSTFRRANLQLVGINHAEPGTHLRTATRKFLRLPLLSDEQFKVARAYNSVFEIGPIKVIRYSVVGIDQKGMIIYLQSGRPSNETIIAGMNATTLVTPSK